MIKRLVYYSTPSGGDAILTSLDILNGAVPANKSRKISGFLICSGSYYLQCLEGPADALDQLMLNILHDLRHTDITIIGEEMTDIRRFPEWGMGYLNQTIPMQQKLSELTGSKTFEPEKLTFSAAVDLLVQLSFII